MNRWSRRRVMSCIGLLAGLAAGAVASAAGGQSIVLASTTSTQDSGFFEYLLPRFRDRSGIEVKVVALGTGQALDMARRGDADVVLVHDPEAERAFVAEGFGIDRRPVMHNDFVLVGPAADPAGVVAAAGSPADVVAAMAGIAARRAPFLSRGDRSGTHVKETTLWKAAGVSPGPGDSWYRSVGQGMGPVLNMTAATAAYTLADRATWLSFRNKADLRVLVEGDARLYNPYSVILVNPARHPHVRAAAAREFAEYLVSAEGQAAIAAFRIAGQVLYHPDVVPGAGRDGARRDAGR